MKSRKHLIVNEYFVRLTAAVRLLLETMNINRISVKSFTIHARHSVVTVDSSKTACETLLGTCWPSWTVFRTLSYVGRGKRWRHHGRVQWSVTRLTRTHLQCTHCTSRTNTQPAVTSRCDSDTPCINTVCRH